jgi:hypothetical protein
MATAARVTRAYSASNVQDATWRRRALRAAFDTQVAYTAVERCEQGVNHLFSVPTTKRLGYRFVVWNCQADDFYCSEHHMHACECSGAALQNLMTRGLLPYMSSDEPAETEANARVWREATS